jgi:hypothetical protein
MNNSTERRGEMKYYRVVATGDVGGGPIRATAREAAEAWDRQAMRCGYSRDQVETAAASCSARLLGYPTRAAARRDDISICAGEPAEIEPQEDNG